MVKHIHTYGLLVLLLISFQPVWAQKHLFTEVAVNKSQVYYGEPVEVSVSVYTNTWFTSGVHVQNIKVNNAFTVYFRSVSNSKSINGKTYAGVIFIYHVFPYSEQDLEFPSLTINVETPDEGDYKGVKRKVKTRSVPIRVNPIPANFKKNDWLVTSGLEVNDRWLGDLKNVKVGDVLERKIYRKAYGTVPELIPPIAWDSVNGISNYPVRPEVNGHQTKTAIYADRTDGMRYLFEKEGEVILPAITLMWWNAQHKKVYKRTLKEVRIDVQPNPDLGILASIKDSLALIHATEAITESEKPPFEFWGMNWKELTLTVIVGLIGIRYFILLFLFLLKKYRENRAAYLGSEKYYFHLFLKSLSKNDTLKRNTFYQWIDCLELEEYTLAYFAKMYTDNADSATIYTSSSYWKNARKTYFKSTAQSFEVKSGWVNP